MQVPDKPADEARRLATLRALDILDTPHEERFDRLTRLASGLFGVPVALTSLVDENRQWFKSRLGLGLSEVPRGISFCGHTILGDGVLLIPDTALDARFHDNPLVAYEPRIRFYAGCPLSAPDGSRPGTFCLMDRVPREFCEDDLALLRSLGSMAGQELAADGMPTMDEPTQLSNRRGFGTLSRLALGLCRRLEKPAALLLFDLERFGQAEDDPAHTEGDRVSRRFARLLRQTFRNADVLGRLGEDRYAALLVNAGRKESNAVLHRLLQTVEECNRADRQEPDIVFRAGSVGFAAARHPDIADLLAEAGTLLHKQKQQRRGRDGPGRHHDGRRTSMAGKYGSRR